MPTNLTNLAVATGLEKVSFHSNPKDGQSKESKVQEGVQEGQGSLACYSPRGHKELDTT